MAKRRRNPKHIRIAGGILNREGFPKWEPTYAYLGRGTSLPEYQTFGLDVAGGLVWAGVSRHSHVNQAIANQIARTWKRTRREYVSVAGADPIQAEGVERLARLVIFPIDAPAERQEFRV